jgi:hypothetical protein
MQRPRVAGFAPEGILATATTTLYVLLAHSLAPHAAANVNEDQIVGIYETQASCAFALNQFPADSDKDKQMYHYCLAGDLRKEPTKQP